MRSIRVSMIAAVAVAILWLASNAAPSRATAPQTATTGDPLDAVAAAPDSHTVLFENEHARVVRVEILPGVKEPHHVHRNPSVMIAYQPTRIRYYGANDEMELESPEGPRPEAASEPKWMEPEGLHAVENIDESPYRAYRIELK